MNANIQLLNNYLPEVLLALVDDYTNPHRENFAAVLRHFDQFGDSDDEDFEDHHDWYTISQVESQIIYCLTCHKSIDPNEVDINTDNYEYRECLACSHNESDEEDEEEDVSDEDDEEKERMRLRYSNDIFEFFDSFLY